MWNDTETNASGVLSRILNTPLLAHPGKAAAVLSVLSRGHVTLNVLATASTASRADPTSPAPRSMGPLQEQRMVQRTNDRPYLFDPNTGIAVIEIVGTLAHRKGFIGKSSGVMGYDGIVAAFTQAIRAPEVRGIILDVHCWGGEVSGAFQASDRIADGRGEKPIIAVVDDVAFSGGYLMISGADEIYLNGPTAEVGSIGVIQIHVSYEAALSEAGIKPTLIFKGARKADGNPMQDLPEGVRTIFDARLEQIYGEFVGRVAERRGISPQRVRQTEAGIFMGEDAVNRKLATGVADSVEVFAALANKLAQPRRALARL